MGNSLSRVSIYPAEIGEDGRPSGTPTTDPKALQAAHDLLGGPSNQAQILQQVGVHLTVAGDCYIVGETPVGSLFTGVSPTRPQPPDVVIISTYGI